MCFNRINANPMHEKDCFPPRLRLPLKGKLAAFADG